MKRIMFDTQLSGVTETTWTLMKYTNLNGRRQVLVFHFSLIFVPDYIFLDYL